MSAKTVLPVYADDAATILGWTDVKPATIIKRTPKSVTVREDAARLLNGPNSGEPDALIVTPGGFAAHVSGPQRYEFTADPDGRVSKYTLRKNGRYVLAGEPATSRARLRLGRRESYYDYNF